ncbi:hypothetical protein D5F01_LYC23868 [Larimichthys crocea]|uniref:Uncharacterized protein n=1 Tax=Larimichthys crocea TaxID=215358 RepID=A0A6G0HGC3_LARCR|nr:hypothetical protein D5F01_LYC23868 [Larimichthys crocea]
MTPKGSMELELAHAGLGKKVVLVPECANHSEIVSLMEGEYMKLKPLMGRWMLKLQKEQTDKIIDVNDDEDDEGDDDADVDCTVGKGGLIVLPLPRCQIVATDLGSCPHVFTSPGKSQFAWKRVTRSMLHYVGQVIEKLGLPLQTVLHLTDESGTEVDADVFEELLQAGDLTIKVSTEKSTVVLHEDQSCTSLESPVWDTSSSPSSRSTEHYYDAESGSGYLAWRIKTVQRNTAIQSRRCSTSMTSTYGPKSTRDFLLIDEQLFGEECCEAISLLKHSTDQSVIKEKMRATFQHRQTLVQDQQASLAVLDVFPRFLDTPGLIDQDFTMMFGGEVSGRFLAKWPSYFKAKILADCKNLISNEHIEDLLSPQQNSNEFGWDSDLSSILLLVHLLPPTAKGHKKSAKISSCQAIDHVVRYLRIGASVETFLGSVEPGQPFLLCVGEQKNNIQRFYVIVDHKAIPCKAQTSLAAFDELFKAHFIFSVNYHESLNNFYTFIQTTVFNIDVGNTKESPRVKELRARLLRTDT